MNRQTIKNILNFLKEKEGHELPKAWFDSIEKLKLIKELENHPDGIQYRYDGDLNLEESNIKKLPKDFYTDDSLNLYDCKQLTELPDKLHVGGYLSLYGCKQLTKLPDNLYVKDSLVMIGTSIEEIPDNLNVGWNLFIGNTPLANKYTDKEIYKMIKLRGGKIINDIIR